MERLHRKRDINSRRLLQQERNAKGRTRDKEKETVLRKGERKGKEFQSFLSCPAVCLFSSFLLRLDLGLFTFSVRYLNNLRFEETTAKG